MSFDMYEACVDGCPSPGRLGSHSWLYDHPLHHDHLERLEWASESCVHLSFAGNHDARVHHPLPGDLQPRQACSACGLRLGVRGCTLACLRGAELAGYPFDHLRWAMRRKVWQSSFGRTLERFKQVDRSGLDWEHETYWMATRFKIWTSNGREGHHTTQRTQLYISHYS